MQAARLSAPAFKNSGKPEDTATSRLEPSEAIPPFPPVTTATRSVRSNKFFDDISLYSVSERFREVLIAASEIQSSLRLPPAVVLAESSGRTLAESASFAV